MNCSRSSSVAFFILFASRTTSGYDWQVKGWFFPVCGLMLWDLRQLPQIMPPLCLWVFYRPQLCITCFPKYSLNIVSDRLREPVRFPSINFSTLYLSCSFNLPFSYSTPVCMGLAVTWAYSFYWSLIGQLSWSWCLDSPMYLLSGLVLNFSLGQVLMQAASIQGQEWTFCKSWMSYAVVKGGSGGLRAGGRGEQANVYSETLGQSTLKSKSCQTPEDTFLLMQLQSQRYCPLRSTRTTVMSSWQFLRWPSGVLRSCSSLMLALSAARAQAAASRASGALSGVLTTMSATYCLESQSQSPSEASTRKRSSGVSQNCIISGLWVMQGPENCDCLCSRLNSACFRLQSPRDRVGCSRFFTYQARGLSPLHTTMSLSSGNYFLSRACSFLDVAFNFLLIFRKHTLPSTRDKMSPLQSPALAAMTTLSATTAASTQVPTCVANPFLSSPRAHSKYYSSTWSKALTRELTIRAFLLPWACQNSAQKQWVSFSDANYAICDPPCPSKTEAMKPAPPSRSAQSKRSSMGLLAAYWTAVALPMTLLRSRPGRKGRRGRMGARRKGSRRGSRRAKQQEEEGRGSCSRAVNGTKNRNGLMTLSIQ